MDYNSAVDLFGPVFVQLDAMVREAYDQFYEIHRDELQHMSPRTRASEVNDRIVAGLYDVLSTIRSPRLAPYSGTKLVQLPGECLIRVKKLDGLGRASYHHTPSSLSFDCNDLLFGIPVESRLYFGYVLARGVGQIDRVVIACPSEWPDSPAIWMINVTEEAAKQTQFFRTPAAAASSVHAKIAVRKTGSE